MATPMDQERPLMTFEEKLKATILSHHRQKLTLSRIQRKRQKASVLPVGLSSSLNVQNIAIIIENLDNYLFDDVMLLVWCERTTFYKPEPTNNNDKSVLPLFFQHWMQLYLKKPDQVISTYLTIIPKYGGWGDLTSIYTCACQMESDLSNEIELLDNLKNACVKTIGDQLEYDHRVVLQQLEEEEANAQEKQIFINNQNKISNCANEVPRISNNYKKSTTIMAKEIALYLQPLAIGIDNNELPSSDWKAYAYESYRSLISTICQRLTKVPSTSVNQESISNKRKERPMFCTRGQRAKILAAPFSSRITNPEPQPVVPRSLDEFKPLLEHLSLNKPGPDDDTHPIVFPRGTIMSGGRLDLCKQVVGPEGVQPLLNAMKYSSYVTRLLLGNNVVGLPGAKAISQYISSNPDSNIDTWYIACNRFDNEGISLICDALTNDTKVKALWLKRNPILVEGTVHIARMLTTNTCLQTLDLLNTGLFDEGCELLFNALKVNHTLKHLCLDANGLTVKSGQTIRLHFEHGHNHLETLTVSCNSLGDAGTCELAAGLKHDQCLKRLGLASNCIGPDGARALVDALINHKTLQQLNLGFMKSTNLLGHVNNAIRDEGAAEISRLIQFNHHIRSIDLTLNGISERGLIQLRDALTGNRTLTTLQGLDIKQLPKKKVIKKEINTILRANQIEWGKQVYNDNSDDVSQLTESDYLKKGQQLDREINVPEYIMDVISHYRVQ